MTPPAHQAVRKPPRYVPTLTDVVTQSAIAEHREPPAQLSPDTLQDQIVHRVMQRVDMSLERRLRETIARLVLDQTRDLAPLLREEIEAVVKKSVGEAIADELLVASRLAEPPPDA